MYPPFVPHSRRLLKENDVTIEFVDIGSRNGIIELVSIAEFVNAYGFEPNPDEYEKLVSGKTDAAKFGIKSPKYRSINYSAYAISDKNGVQPFYVTKGPGAAGMKEPNIDRLREIKWMGAAYEKSFAEDIFAIERILDIDARTIENFAKEKSLSHIDYLKIDVEGSEYEVLSGAGDFLNNVGVIKVEVCFIPFRKEQKLFSDVDLLLRKFGFDLLRFETSPVQVGFKERTSSWSFGPVIGVPERFGQLLQCDAIYVNRGIQDRKRAIAQAMILLEKNYLDEALFILKRRAGVEFPELLALLKTYNGQWRVRLLDSIFKFAKWLLKPSSNLWK